MTTYTAQVHHYYHYPGQVNDVNSRRYHADCHPKKGQAKPSAREPLSENHYNLHANSLTQSVSLQFTFEGGHEMMHHLTCMCFYKTSIKYFQIFLITNYIYLVKVMLVCLYHLLLNIY